ncbi:hypothetical protein SNE40_019742 [Patella caerulea]|uniref:Ketimine reductase mu-crystallin n=1 Tax=Patella caerulea TaxID=87958 RepID=A0AAN8J700_PATCE
MAACVKQISSATVMSVLKYEDLIPEMEKAMSKVSSMAESGVDQPVRTVVKIKPADGYLGVMPVYSQYDNLLAAKLLCFYPHNSLQQEPSHYAIIMVFDAKNGAPKAMVDGDKITEMRTAAVSAVATKYLSPADPQVLAILGSGVQARSHCIAMRKIYPFKEVRIWSRNFANAEKLAKEMNGLACKTAEEAVSGADVINTVTSSPIPIIKLEWIKPGAHINAVGACRYDWNEIDPAIMQAAVVYVDSKDAAVKESGDIIMSKAEIYGELGEMILGVKEAKRDQLTVFKSLGLAIQDAVAAKMVLDRTE